MMPVGAFFKTFCDGKEEFLNYFLHLSSLNSCCILGIEDLAQDTEVESYKELFSLQKMHKTPGSVLFIVKVCKKAEIIWNRS